MKKGKGACKHRAPVSQRVRRRHYAEEDHSDRGQNSDRGKLFSSWRTAPHNGRQKNLVDSQSGPIREQQWLLTDMQRLLADDSGRMASASWQTAAISLLANGSGGTHRSSWRTTYTLCGRKRPASWRTVVVVRHLVSQLTLAAL